MLLQVSLHERFEAQDTSSDLKVSSVYGSQTILRVFCNRFVHLFPEPVVILLSTLRWSCREKAVDSCKGGIESSLVQMALRNDLEPVQLSFQLLNLIF
jgi:hypothetical protein